MSATAAAAKPAIRRARVTDVSITELPDGRREMAVSVVLPDGAPARMLVQGDCYIPVPAVTEVADELDLFAALGLVLEVVPRAAARTAAGRVSPWAEPPRRAA